MSERIEKLQEALTESRQMESMLGNERQSFIDQLNERAERIEKLEIVIAQAFSILKKYDTPSVTKVLKTRRLLADALGIAETQCVSTLDEGE